MHIDELWILSWDNTMVYYIVINNCILEWGWFIVYEVYVDEIIVRCMIECGKYEMWWY